MLLNINQNWPKKWAPKNDNFSHVEKRRFKKKFCCNPPFDQKLVFFNFAFFNHKTLMLNKKHNLKSGKSKDKKKGLGKTTRQNPPPPPKKKEKSCNLMFWCCSFHETKAKKKEKERRREKQGRTRKQKRKTRRKELRKEQERDRERGIEKGGG